MPAATALRPELVRTSYFAQWKRHHWSGAVSIARTDPPWYAGKRYVKLAPPATMLAWWRAESKKHAGDEEKLAELWERYCNGYRSSVLDVLDPARVAAELRALAGSDVVLLCHEADRDCHRYLVAAWLGEHLGTEVAEVPVERKVKAKKANVAEAQGRLL